jgi:hypothetical protein
MTALISDEDFAKMRRTPILTVEVEGRQPMMEHLPDNRFSVTFGKTFVGKLERRSSDDWRIVQELVPDPDLGSVLQTVVEGTRYVTADDAVYDLIRGFGYPVKRCQTTFREAVTHDLDLSPERKRELIALCDEEGL